MKADLLYLVLGNINVYCYYLYTIILSMTCPLVPQFSLPFYKQLTDTWDIADPYESREDDRLGRMLLRRRRRARRRPLRVHEINTGLRLEFAWRYSDELRPHTGRLLHIKIYDDFRPLWLPLTHRLCLPKPKYRNWNREPNSFSLRIPFGCRCPFGWRGSSSTFCLLLFVRFRFGVCVNDL